MKADEHSHTTKEFDLVDPWFNFAAKLEKGGTIHTFSAMFGQRLGHRFGPHNAASDKKGNKLRDMITVASQEVQDALEKARAGVAAGT